MFTDALITIAKKKRKPTKHASGGEWINIEWCGHTVEYYTEVTNE